MSKKMQMFKDCYNNGLDVATTIQACEKAGIKTTLAEVEVYQCERDMEYM